MKQHIAEFMRRGMMACFGGPVILAVIYAIQGATGTAETLTYATACKEILTITALAFIAGSITAIYRIERLPLFPALVIHGAVLYFDYLIIYLVNGWLASGLMPFLIFSVCFIAGYAVIWLCIYLSIRHKTNKLNEALHKT